MRNFQMGKPTHSSRMQRVESNKNGKPAWYAGDMYVRARPGSKTGGKNNSGSSKQGRAASYGPAFYQTRSK